MIVDRTALSERQHQNLSAALRAYDGRCIRSSARPVALFLELTRNCISRCSYCRKVWVNEPSFDMTRNTFDTVLHECVPYASFIDVRSYGESLMLPAFAWYLEQLSPICPNLRITTTLGCGNQAALRALIDHNVFVSVSFDAANKELYERYRRGISYDVVMQNMQLISGAMLRKHGDLRGRMRIGIAPLYRDNLEHVDGVLELAHTLHIPEIRIVPLSTTWHDPNNLFYHKRRVLHVLQKAIEKAHLYDIELQFASPVIPSLKLPDKVSDRCFKPCFYAVVMFDGRIRLCDWQIELEESRDDLGNVHDGIESVWNGDKAQRLRAAHLEPRQYSPTCNKCYRTGRYSDHEHDLDATFGKWLVTGNDVKNRVEEILHGLWRV